MQRPSQQAVQLFRRTRDFLTRAAPTSAYGPLEPHVEALGSAAELLSAAAIELDTRTLAARAGTLLLRARTRTLRREFMRPIARLASARFKDAPEVRASLRMPKDLRTPEALVAAAHAMANAAEQHKAQFLAAGFPETFVAQLREAAALVVQSIDQRAHEVARRSASVAAVRGETARGRLEMGLLDSMVAPRLESNGELAAEWRSLMRQGRTRRAVVEELPDTPPSGGSGSDDTPVVKAA